jgi:hypothetical protein
MSEQISNAMNPEQSESFMSDSHSRAEVNQYLNTLFLAVNNSIGVFHATSMTALTSVLATELAALGANITGEELLTRVTEENIRIVKETQERMKEVSQNGASAPDMHEATAKEVDVSVF